MNRIPYYDIVKGMGIVLVYAGHTVLYGTLPSLMIYSFHMPLFLVVSGLFFDPIRIDSASKLWRRIAIGLLIPWVILSLMETILRFDVIYPLWLDDPLRQLVWLLHGEGGLSLWFLVALAGSMGVSWFACEVFRSRWTNLRFRLLLLLSLMILAQMMRIIPIDKVYLFPLELPSVPGCTFFLLIGSFMREWLKQCVEWARNDIETSIAIGMFSLGVLAVLCTFNPHCFNLKDARFNVVALPSCAMGLLSIGCLAAVVERVSLLRRLFAYIGRYSLCIFAVEHQLDHIFCKVLSWFNLPNFQTPCNMPHPISYGILRNVVLLIVAGMMAPLLMFIIEKVRKLSFPQAA